jgi:hypothetical protein
MIQAKCDAMSEVLAITSGGRVLGDAIELRFANVTNELYRLDKNKADRAELQELQQALGEKSSTHLSVKCLSCSRASAPPPDRCGSRKFNDFPPSYFLMQQSLLKPSSSTSPLHQSSSPLTSHPLVSSSAAPSAGEIQSSTTAARPELHSDGRRRRGTPQSPATISSCISISSTIIPPRRKLQNFYDWLKIRSQDESMRPSDVIHLNTNATTPEVSSGNKKNTSSVKTHRIPNNGVVRPIVTTDSEPPNDATLAVAPEMFSPPAAENCDASAAAIADDNDDAEMCHSSRVVRSSSPRCQHQQETCSNGPCSDSLHRHETHTSTTSVVSCGSVDAPRLQ